MNPPRCLVPDCVGTLTVGLDDGVRCTVCQRAFGVERILGVLEEARGRLAKIEASYNEVRARLFPPKFGPHSPEEWPVFFEEAIKVDREHWIHLRERSAKVEAALGAANKLIAEAADEATKSDARIAILEAALSEIRALCSDRERFVMLGPRGFAAALAICERALNGGDP